MHVDLNVLKKLTHIIETRYFLIRITIVEKIKAQREEPLRPEEGRNNARVTSLS